MSSGSTCAPPRPAGRRAAAPARRSALSAPAPRRPAPRSASRSSTCVSRLCSIRAGRCRRGAWCRSRAGRSLARDGDHALHLVRAVALALDGLARLVQRLLARQLRLELADAGDGLGVEGAEVEAGLVGGEGALAGRERAARAAPSPPRPASPASAPPRGCAAGSLPRTRRRRGRRWSPRRLRGGAAPWVSFCSRDWISRSLTTWRIGSARPRVDGRGPPSSPRAGKPPDVGSPGLLEPADSGCGFRAEAWL